MVKLVKLVVVVSRGRGLVFGLLWAKKGETEVGGGELECGKQAHERVEMRKG